MQIPSILHCSRCDRWLAVTEFHRGKGQRLGYQAWCRQCITQYRLEHPPKIDREKKRAADRRDYRRHQAARRVSAVEQRLIARYGITMADYHELLERQNGRCAICRTAVPGGRGDRFHVDHDLATGRVRGLLCWNCNRRLGVLENLEFRVAADAYLADAAEMWIRLQ